MHCAVVYYIYEIDALINPRHACAASVIVVGLCVCMYVCVRVFATKEEYQGFTTIPGPF